MMEESGDVLNMTEMGKRLIEDEYGYVVDSVEDLDNISKDIISQLPSNKLDEPDLVPHSSLSLRSTKKKRTLKRSETRYKTMKMKRVGFNSLNLNDDVDKVYEFLMSDPTAEENEIRNDLREMYQSLTVKRMVKAKIDHTQEKRHIGSLNCCSRVHYRFAVLWEQMKNGVKDLSYSLELWHNAIKTIQGHGGSVVASYFIFLRWLLYLNIFNAIVVVSFVVTPQLILDSNSHSTKNATGFSGYDLLTGSGWLGNSSLFYGHYSNETIEVVIGYRYSIPLSYLFTTAFIAFVNMIVVAYSVTKAYQVNYVSSSHEINRICAKVFCAWDFNIEKADTANLRHQLIYQELKDLLSRELSNVKSQSCLTLTLKCGILFIVNCFVLGTIAAVGYLTYYILQNRALEVEIKVLKMMTLSLTITAISFLFHYVMLFATKLEFFFSKQIQLYLLLGRVAMLRIVILSILAYFWMAVYIPGPGDTQCYESLLGEEIYRFIVVNFLMSLLLRSILGEFLRKVMSRHLCCTKGLVRLPEFDVAYNINDIIYYQTLVWFGSFYAPLLPVVFLIILVALFYIRFNAVLRNCRPSQKPWSSSEAQTVFLIVTLTNFLLTMIAVGYTIFYIKPSTTCGPFRTHETMYGVIADILNLSKEQHQLLIKIIRYITSPSLLFTVILTLGVIAHFTRARCIAHGKIVEEVRQQLIMESKDKVFLLRLFESAYKRYLSSIKSKQRNEAGDRRKRNIRQTNVQVHRVDADSIRDVKNQAFQDYNPPSEIAVASTSSPVQLKYDPGYLMADVPINRKGSKPEDASEPLIKNDQLPRPLHKQGFQYGGQKEEKHQDTSNSEVY